MYLPVNDIRQHSIAFNLVQLKMKTMTHVSAEAWGLPGSVMMTYTKRHWTFAAQGINTMTMNLLLQSLHRLNHVSKTGGGGRKRMHKVSSTDREEGAFDKVRFEAGKVYT